MIDLHTHSIFSDGELIPTELARRAQVLGCRAIAITDHADHSNVDFIVPRIVKVCKMISSAFSMRAIPGIELTHVHPDHISDISKEARKMGAALIVVHGETIVEPVIPGTNLAAVRSPIDILAHPGLVSDEVSQIASENSVCFEISTRKGHSLTNGHVLRYARKFNVNLVLNTDSHAPGDLIDKNMARKIAAGAGMTDEEIEEMFRNSEYLVRKSLP
jgi:histidinol phosphatase-like PHP family hydrolase